MLELRFLTEKDEKTFRAAVMEFKLHNPDWGFAFNLDDSKNFTYYCDLLSNQSHGRDLRGFVPNSYMGAFVNGKCIGRSSIRHELNDMLRSTGGHIGYGVIPSERGKGYAREILRLSLEYLKAKGLNRVLVTCSDDNIASIRTIESNGGVLENKVSSAGANEITRRYWFDFQRL
jgi:predicted acetyltransferase